MKCFRRGAAAPYALLNGLLLPQVSIAAPRPSAQLSSLDSSDSSEASPNCINFQDAGMMLLPVGVFEVVADRTTTSW